MAKRRLNHTGLLAIMMVSLIGLMMGTSCNANLPGLPGLTEDTTDDEQVSGSSAGPEGSTSEGEETTSTDGSSPDGPPGVMGAIRVNTIASAANTYFDITNQVTNQSLLTYQASNSDIAVLPGVYRLTQYFNADFVYASDVVVTAGATTTVTLGAIELVPVSGASDGSFDIYDSTGASSYSTYNDANTLITAPAGTFTLKEYFNANFTYANGVTVTEGASTTVQMGGIRLTTVAGAADGTYAIYDATGSTVYASYNDPDVIITAPAGTFTLKEYFNDRFTYASGVTVVAGSTTDVPMGAIRYNGTLAYDIYSGGALVSSYNEAGKIITAPAGTYTLTEYFNEDNVLDASVVVAAGAITDVN